jgi:hypothetical protein
MTTRHFTRRPPKKHDTAWGRFPSDDCASVTYRLFRRDHLRCTQMETRMFFRDTPRVEIARSLWKARIQLRKFVDDLQLQAWGLAA